MPSSSLVPPPYKIVNVDGSDPAVAEVLRKLNNLFKDEFYDLDDEALNGWSWFVHDGPTIVGFAIAVTFTPFTKYGYIKRTAILREHRGHGLQRHLIERAEACARKNTSWTHMVSSCDYRNVASANTFIRCGYRLTQPARPWDKTSLFWIKTLL